MITAPAPHVRDGNGAPTRDEAEHGHRFRVVAWAVLRWLVLLAPAMITTWLVKSHAVNMMLWDDFLFGAEWVRFEQGTLDWRELFGVHMEHRQVLARSLSLLLHQIFDDDIRAQNALSVIFLWATAGMMLWLAKRTLGDLRGTNYWLAFALMLALFSPIQWQTLLWAICFALFMSMAFFTAAVLPWFSRLSDGKAFAVSFGFALLDTVAFANGLMVWFLVPVAMVFGRPASPWKSRRRMLAVWVAGAAIVLGLYFHNFTNTVNPAYAYGQGGENTLAHSAVYAITHPVKFVLFVGTLLGGNLSRGLQVDNLLAASVIGMTALLLVLLVLVCLARSARADGLASLVPAVPWLVLGAFSIGTAAMIGLGRAWIGDGLPQAITARYTTHAIMLTGVLPILVAFAGRRWLPGAKTLGIVALTSLVVLQATQWVFGARMMQVWHHSRLADLALSRFAGLFPDGSAFAVTAGDGPFGCQVLRDLNAMDRVNQKLLPDTRLSRLDTKPKSLTPDKAGFTRWDIDAKGHVLVAGYACVAKDHPADLVLFTQKINGVEEIIAVLSASVTTPAIAPRQHREFEFTRFAKADNTSLYAWKGPPILLQKPVEDQAIQAYAFDEARDRIFLIPDLRPENAGVVRVRNQ